MAGAVARFTRRCENYSGTLAGQREACGQIYPRNYHDEVSWHQRNNSNLTNPLPNARIRCHGVSPRRSVLHHPNVVLFLGACTKKPNLCLVLEYCTHRSLHHFLKNEDKHHIRITMSHVLRFALDIARGVYYLHRKQSIVQRDLKARNILVDESLNAKVADFGLSRVIDEEEANKLTACGTPAWTAPEVVRMEQYTEKVDVYSFGIIMWELITRQEPYGGRKGVQIAYAAAEQGLRPDIPSYCP